MPSQSAIRNPQSAITIGGTIAIDHVKTPADEAAGLLGGSAAYAALAASYFTRPVHLVGIVGADFPPAHLAMLERHGVTLDGVERSPGDSFSWSGEYHRNMNTRTTHKVAVNVLETWQPAVPAAAAAAPLVVLANMSPDNQLAMLAQCPGSAGSLPAVASGEGRVPSATPDPASCIPHPASRIPRPFVIADTMDLWISIARPRLLEVLQQIDLLVLNDSEARELTGADNLVEAAAALLALGPRHLVIKLGEHGALLASPPANPQSAISNPQFFRSPAIPLATLVDPTGAGDTFLGALAGYLAAVRPVGQVRPVGPVGPVRPVRPVRPAAGSPARPPASAAFSFSTLCHAVLRGTVAASFTCEAFSTRRLENLTPADFAARLDSLRQLSQWPEEGNAETLKC